MKKNIAVVITGCGYKDGSEITESIASLIALSEAKVNVNIYAPSISFSAIDHFEESLGESRNTLREAARIARGKIQDLSALNSKSHDALVFPGGFGAVTQLSNWATLGSKATVLPTVTDLINQFHSFSKPIGAFCIAPTLLAAVLGPSTQLSLTIGNDLVTAQEIEKTGAHHIDCSVTDFVTDRENKVVTTPAYMYDASPFEVFTGIRSAIKEICEMA